MKRERGSNVSQLCGSGPILWEVELEPQSIVWFLLSYMELGRGGFEAVPGSLLSLLFFFPSQSRVVSNNQNMWLLSFPSVNHMLCWSCQLWLGWAWYCLGAWHASFPVIRSVLDSSLRSVKEKSFCSSN